MSSDWPGARPANVQWKGNHICRAYLDTHKYFQNAPRNTHHFDPPFSVVHDVTLPLPDASVSSRPKSYLKQQQALNFFSSGASSWGNFRLVMLFWVELIRWEFPMAFESEIHSLSSRYRLGSRRLRSFVCSGTYGWHSPSNCPSIPIFRMLQNRNQTDPNGWNELKGPIAFHKVS